MLYRVISEKRISDNITTIHYAAQNDVRTIPVGFALFDTTTLEQNQYTPITPALLDATLTILSTLLKKEDILIDIPPEFTANRKNAPHILDRHLDDVVN